MHLFYSVDVQGKERLHGLRGPVLFAANHSIKMDNPLIIMAMPFGWATDSHFPEKGRFATAWNTWVD